MAVVISGSSGIVLPADAAVTITGESWNGVSYTDPDAVGANPTAKIYPDGTIVGSTDNGHYTKHPNGNLDYYRWYGVGNGSSVLTSVGLLTFPHPFVYLGGITSMFRASTSGSPKPYGYFYTQPTLTNFSMKVQNMGTYSNVYLTATGRWK
jgi:hypothetical protein